MLNPQATIPPSNKNRRALTWIGLGLIACLTAGFIAAAAALRSHADERLAVMKKIGEIETAATEQSAIVWRAMTLLLSEEQGAFVRLRGEEQRGRGDVYAMFDELRELDGAGVKLNQRLGFEDRPEDLESLESAMRSFLGGVQGSLGMMTLNMQHIKHRIRGLEMDFEYFVEALDVVQARNSEIALAASTAAERVTAGAALFTLFTAALLMLRLGFLRARRERDLAAQHIETLQRSEAGFRELVQHSSDLILVVDSGGDLRYASPSASQLDLDELLELQPETLLEKERREIAVADSNGVQRTYDLRATDLRGNTDVNGVVLNATDITARKELEDRLRYQALHDPLTDLPNRRQFQLRFDALEADQRESSCVLFVDLDGFKRVNDSFGHAAGDALLKSTALRIRTCLDRGEVLARQGGDEFLILSSGDGLDLGERILKALGAPFEIEGDEEIFVSASIGVASELEGLDAEQAAQRADIAMYAAKQAGRAQTAVFEEKMLAGAPDRLRLESDFRLALERGEFQVHYQPKVGFSSGRIESLEALVRWISPTRGFVGPDSFIPFAEESGLICELGQFVLEQSCADALRWQERGVVVAVNLSPVQFRNPDLVAQIAETIERSGVNPALIELEITESAVLGDLDNTVAMLRELKALGLRLAIDDFGTGYSNLAHLKHFDVDVLKIDQAFVRGGNPGAVDHLSDQTIVEAVIAMAKAFGLHVVAEGVESEEHVTALRDLGADLGQGYFFSKPVPGTSIDELLAAEDSEFGLAA